MGHGPGRELSGKGMMNGYGLGESDEYGHYAGELILQQNHWSR